MAKFCKNEKSDGSKQLYSWDNQDSSVQRDSQEQMANRQGPERAVQDHSTGQGTSGSRLVFFSYIVYFA